MSIYLFLLLFLFSVVPVKGGEKYGSQYDSIDYRAILGSERLLKHYYDCLMDKGHCTPDGQVLKETIPDALQTECDKCTEKQKHAAKEIIEFFVKNKRDWWDHLVAKYDPHGVYKEKYHEEWKEEGYPL